MTSRNAILASLVIIAAAVPFLRGEAASDRSPNVIVVLFDDLGFSDLGCYGGEMPTPHIDRLAANGLRFTEMTNSARCCPSRASLLTGLHPSQAGIPDFTGRPAPKKGPAYRGRLAENCVTLAGVLQRAGYSTYGVGKWHVGEEDALPTRRGFDEFWGYTKGYAADQWTLSKYHRLPADREPEIDFDEGDFYATDAFNDYSVEFLEQAHAKEAPWFLYLAHSSPHFPVQAPMATAKPLLDTYRRGWDALREERFERMRASGLCNHDGWTLTPRSLVPVDRDDIANGFSGKPNPAWDELPEDRREDLAHRMALFAASVKHIDDGVGRIVELLEKQGTLDDTLFLVLSDNGACYEWGPFGFDGVSRRGITTLHSGEALETMGGPGSWHSYGSAWANLGNTPFRLYKHFTHQGGMVTPFIAHWPAGIENPNRWVRDPAHIIDVMPTLVEVADAKYPKKRNGLDVTPMEGVSLAATFKGGALPARALAYQHQGARALREGDWKLVYGKRFPEEVAWELYNITDDPCEMKNLAAVHPERVEAMSKDWLVWARRVGLTPFWQDPDAR